MTDATDMPDPTPAELDLLKMIHNLKAQRIRTDDSWELLELQQMIYELSQAITAIRYQQRQCASSPNHEATGGA